MTDLPDFDKLKELAQTDPDALLRLKDDLINAFIASAPLDQQARLKALQWRIDQEAEKAKSPMAACIAISGMMHDSFDALRDALNAAAGNHDLVIRKDKPEGKVVEFKR